MGLVSEVRARFTASADGFRSTVQGIAQDTRNLENQTHQMTGSMTTSFRSMLGTLGKLGGAYYAFKEGIEGIKGIAENTIGANMEMENYEATLTTVLKSHEKATDYLQWATKFAATTPFEIPGIVEATAKLSIYGIDAKKTLSSIGNMAAIMGKPLDQAVEAVADAQTGELERLKEFGITKQMLIDKAQELYHKDIVNGKGQITDMKALNKAMFAIMDERYKNGMDIMSKTASGMISNVQDSMGTMMREMSKPAFEVFKKGLASLLPVLGAVTQVVQGDWKGMKKTMTDAFGADVANKFEQFMLTLSAMKNALKQMFTDLKPSFENIKQIFINLSPLAKAMGTALVGAFIGVTKVLPPIINGITEIVKAITGWEGFIPIVAGLASGFVALKAGLAVAMGISKLRTALLLMSNPISRAIWLTQTWQKVQAFMNATLLANPIVAVIALIVAIGVALVVAYKRSETFRNFVNGLWDGMKSAWQAVANFFTQTIPQWWSVLMGYFQAGWNWLKGFFSQWGTVILAVIAPFIGIPLLIYQNWDKIKAWFSNLWSNILQGLSGFISFFQGLWNSVVAFVMPIINGFISAVKTAWSNFVTNIMTVIRPIITFFKETWNNIKLLVLGIVGVFLNLLLGRFDDVKLSLKAIWVAIQRQIKTTVTAIKDVSLAIFKIFVNGAKAVFNTLKSALTSIWNGIKSTAVSVWNGLKSAVSAIVNGIKSATIATWNAIKSGVVSAVNGLKNGAVSAWNALKSFISGAVNGIKSFVTSGFNGAKSSGVSAFNALKSGVSNAISAVKSYVSGLKDKIVGTFKGINLASIGRNIIQGLLNGITGMAKSVWNKANEIADGIKSRIKKALSIHSPSRVMAEIGGYTGQGLVVGLDSMKKKVHDASTRLAGQVKKGTAIALGGAMTAKASVSNALTLRHVIDLANVPMGVDGTALRKAVIQALGDKRVQTVIDQVNYENLMGQKRPKGR